jgi:hypothetical protein
MGGQVSVMERRETQRVLTKFYPLQDILTQPAGVVLVRHPFATAGRPCHANAARCHRACGFPHGRVDTAKLANARRREIQASSIHPTRSNLGDFRTSDEHGLKMREVVARLPPESRPFSRAVIH